MATVFVGSRLPFGLTLEHPVTGAKVEIAGHSRSDGGRIIVPYGETEVDKDYWEAWVKENKDYPALKNGVIFAQANQKELARMAQDFEGADARTGLEPAPQEASGIAPADKK